MVRSNHYDVVIRNGRVMDAETLLDEVCNLGIRGGRIVAITREALEDAAKVIDATDHVVAPGFIDTHHHWPSAPTACASAPAAAPSPSKTQVGDRRGPRGRPEGLSRGRRPQPDGWAF